MLNDHHNLEELHSKFIENGRINIKDAFQNSVAEKLLQTLTTDVPWQMSYMNGSTPFMVTDEQMEQATPKQIADTYALIDRQAATGFQFCYSHYSVTGENLVYCPESSYLNTFRDFLLSSEFIDFAKSLTGNTEVDKLEILAARYSKKDFLLTHNDIQKPERRIAFVLNLSQGWKVDWGGLLHFLDRDGSVLETYVPTFNSLTFFTVPFPHCVSYVAPFVEQSRYSITGWLTV